MSVVVRVDGIGDNAIHTILVAKAVFEVAPRTRARPRDQACKEVCVEIVLREAGGLGNQLFQYAALRYYARRYGATMRIVVDPPWNAQSYGYPRPCLLSHFNLSVPMRERTPAERLLLTDKTWLKAAVAPLKWVRRVQVFSQQPSRRYLFLRDIPLRPLVKTLYLVGWWHTHHMIDELEEELRREFTFKEPPQGKNLEILKQIEQSRNPVSLHVRRGDTLLAATNRSSLPGSYYSDAIARLKAQLVDPTFFAFSDDIAFVKENMPIDTRTVFVENNDDFAAHEDIRLMAACHHHIIANSTFSWWGAWLSPHQDKIVIAPKHWYLSEDSYYPELMPQTWKLADVASLA